MQKWRRKLHLICIWTVLLTFKSYSRRSIITIHMFDINNFKTKVNNTRYAKRIEHLTSENRYTLSIESTAENSIKNINEGVKSFVIYGEPQSGKTEMMIALTARLLDEGFKIIIILLNDSVQLLGQNLERFRRSGIDPSPKNFNEILDPSVLIGKNEWIIFCKKNSQDLQKLLQKIGSINRKVVIDDEADFATPNSKVNKEEKTKINELTAQLIVKEGIYIGVTATPARLDLNNTHNNQNTKWIDFLPHPLYKGQDVFFPTPPTDLPYCLSMLPDSGDDPKFLREKLFSFLINVAHLNIKINNIEHSYSMLIHTSGKTADHAEDFKQIIKIFEVLKNENNQSYEKYYKHIYEIAKERYPGEESDITQYIIDNKNRNTVIVMNSDKEKNLLDNTSATSPATLFTIIIGGNIVSRGVTFENLLSMFFTRDVKHKIQQDTYIQRARMFGTRGPYMQFFELSIPEGLYLSWHKCFIFHRLSLASRRTGSGIPVWLEDSRISAAAANSVDKTTVDLDKGEMSFDIFEYTKSFEEIIEHADSNMAKLKKFSDILGKEKLPDYLIDYIKNFSPEGDDSIVIHRSGSINGYKDANQEEIRRARGFIGDRELELQKFPRAIHHFKILFNEKNFARIFYKYRGNIRFIKNNKKND